MPYGDTGGVAGTGGVRGDGTASEEASDPGAREDTSAIVERGEATDERVEGRPAEASEGRGGGGICARGAEVGTGLCEDMVAQQYHSAEQKESKAKLKST